MREDQRSVGYGTERIEEMIARGLDYRPSCVHWIEKWTETWAPRSGRRLR